MNVQGRDCQSGRILSFRIRFQTYRHRLLGISYRYSRDGQKRRPGLWHDTDTRIPGSGWNVKPKYWTELWLARRTLKHTHLIMMLLWVFVGEGWVDGWDVGLTMECVNNSTRELARGICGGSLRFTWWVKERKPIKNKLRNRNEISSFFAISSVCGIC